MLVMFLIAAVCPLLPTADIGAAESTVELLPQGFNAKLLNNRGEVAGTFFQDGITQAAIYKDGELKVLPGGAVWGVYDFNDAGQVLATSQTGLQVKTVDGSQSLPKPIIDGDETSVYSGFGPDESGRVIGIMGWNYDYRTNAVKYQGASPPDLVTSVSTVMAVNHKGMIIGQNTGSPATYSTIIGGSVSPMTGLVGQYVFPTALSDGGHFLYSGQGGRYLWHQGKSTLIEGGTPMNVNDNGVVLIETSGSSDRASIRFENGRVQAVSKLIGGLPGNITGLYNSTDLNNDCDVLSWAMYQEGAAPTQYRMAITHVPSCEANDFEGNFFRTDNSSPSVNEGEGTEVRLRVANVSGDEMTGVSLTNVEVLGVDNGVDQVGDAELVQVGENLPGVLAASGLASQGFVDFTLAGLEEGRILLSAKVAGTRDGKAVSGTIESQFSVRAEDLVVNLTLDPPEYEVPEDGEFEPTDITATVSFTNATDDEMTNLRLQDLDVSRVFSGQELYVTYKSGIRPDPLDPEIIVASLPAGATSPEFQAVFTATDDGEVEFSAMATAKRGETGEATGVKKVRWKAKVKKYVEITTKVTNPPDDELIEAGSPVSIDGTIENLTNNYKITLGPLFPELEGNAGTMTLAYDELAPNPQFPVAVDPLVLEPGEKRTFQVRFTTNFSDPRMYEAQPSGGTRAYARFEPWGLAEEVKDPNDGPPDVVEIRTYDEAKPGAGTALGEEPDAQVKATSDDLFKRISIDDSIELPSHPPTAIAAGIMLGAVQGLGNAAIAAIYAIPDLLKMPYTVLVAAYEYQTKIWDGFTDEEKDLFLTESSFLIVSVLQRNVEYGLRDAQELYDEVYKMAGDHLTKTQNEWHTGDYMKTTVGYSAFMSEQIGSVAGPILLSKMAQSPKAVAALEKVQTTLNAKMAATFAAAKNVKFVDNVLPILQSIENGAEPTLTAIAKLWGVTPEEIAEYKRICGIIGCLANIRSRHASSIEWIRKWGALLKPENLKIKTVSELDVMLGYKFEDLGSLIFRKPEILKTLGSGATKDQIAAEAARFAASKGFTPGTKEFNEAVIRLEDRVSEWNKYQKTYKQWNDRGWIDTSFNYEGNAIPEYRYNAQGEVIGKLTGGQKGKYTGFKMKETSPGSDEYVVMMLDGKTGKWRRVTGDIDPVDFTYTDGSPLSPEDHAKLVNLLQNSPIGAEHGYTSTFLGFKDPKTGAVIVKPGPELVKKQFKPNEPALQISPDGPPRATRIDVENSRWESPYDYNIRWVNGYVDAGTRRGRGAAGSVDANFDVIPLDAPAQIALPVHAKPADPTVGKFVIKHGNKGDTAALIMGSNGLVQSVLPDGTTKDSPLHEQAFTEGASQTITVAPASTLVDDGSPSEKAIRAQSATSALSRWSLLDSQTRSAEGALSVGATTIKVAAAAGLAGAANGFEVGQQIAIGAGTDHVELRRVTRMVGDVLTLSEPLSATHDPGEVVMMVVSATGVPINPDKGVDPVADGGSGSGGNGTTDGTGSGSNGSGSPATDGGSGSRPGADRVDGNKRDANQGSGVRGILAYTGSQGLWMLILALVLLTLGAVTRFVSPASRKGLNREGRSR
ncbi:MAG: hypothetical protein WBA45_08670 [Microthrixaceae bacterium]